MSSSAWGAHQAQALLASPEFARLIADAEAKAEARGREAVEVCEMTHTPPFDFAQCEIHDETFPLGQECRFNGRRLWEVFAEEAGEQRQRAVMAEMRAEEAEAP